LPALASIAQKTQPANNVAIEAITSPTIPSALPQFAMMAPPKAPKVTCIGDQLTIAAENSTLGAVLDAVHSCIGVQVDIPDGATGKRVFENLGPGPAREVLESLLDGTGLNFAIGSSLADPQKVDSILLLLRPTETLATAVADRTLTPARRAWLQSRQNGRPATPLSDDTNQTPIDSSENPIAEDAAPAPVDASKPPAGQAPTSDAASPAQNTSAASVDGNLLPISTTVAASGVAPAANQNTSTADKIANMQQMFQQRIQINQTQNQSPIPTSPQP